MLAGEFFVNLGIKNADVAVKSVEAVQGSMNKLAHSSLEAKAAALGAMYAIERVIAGGAAFGKEWKVFGESTQINIIAAQKWAAALEDVNVSAEETMQTFESMQKVLVGLVKDHNMPPWLGFLIQQAHITPEEVTDPRSVPKIMEKMRELSKGLDSRWKPFMYDAYSALGINPHFAQGLSRLKQNPEEMKGLRITGTGEIDNLAALDARWTKFMRNFKADMNDFASSSGHGLVKTLQGALTVIEKIAHQMHEMGVGVGAIETAFTLIVGAISPIAGVITGLLTLIGEWQKYQHGDDSIFGKVNLKKGEKPADSIGELITSKIYSPNNKNTDKKMFDFLSSPKEMFNEYMLDMLLLKSAIASHDNGPTVVNVNQTNNHTGTTKEQVRQINDTHSKLKQAIQETMPSVRSPVKR